MIQFFVLLNADTENQGRASLFGQGKQFGERGRKLVRPGVDVRVGSVD